MLSTPQCGWSTMKIGKFKKKVSYLTDVPNDLLHAMINFLETGSGAATFECEPYKFDLILSHNFAKTDAAVPYIVSWKRKIYVENVSVIELAAEVYHDIKTDLDAWSEWGHETTTPEIVKQNKQIITKNLEHLEKLLANQPG